ncbi:MAG TPA: shikimate dehydrogenase [Saprospiraceae bacterium]|nr:shikimate dehydrogenase [Saprospiraceae bacterium]
MKNFGIIGYPLTHTFSPSYFNNKFKDANIDAFYDRYPLEDISEFCALTEQKKFVGMNVTIPHKQAIMPLLDEIDIAASQIGAVNTIKFVNGKSIGYNTDAYGFEISLLDLIQSPEKIDGALVLGAGGAAKAVCFVLEKLGISYEIVSRSKGDFKYDDINQDVMNRHHLIINTTPLGMSPDVKSAPVIPYECLNEKYFLYDLVYNPEKTIFLTEGLERGCKIKNGYDMLILQAEKAWDIWNQPET